MSEQRDILYVAAAAAEVEPYCPPAIREQYTTETECHRCGAAVLAVREAIESVRLLGIETGRAVIVVCFRCHRDLVADPNKVPVIHFHNPRLESHLRQRVAELN